MTLLPPLSSNPSAPPVAGQGRLRERVLRLGRRRANQLRVIGFAAFSAIMLTLGFAADLWIDYRHQIEQGEITATKLALALEEYARAVFGGADAAVQQAMRRIEELDRFGDTNLAEQFRVLRETADTLPTLQGLTRLDAAGRLVAQSTYGVLAQPIDLSDRDHFQALRAAARNELFIGVPVLSRLGEETPLVPFARRLEKQDGRFDGVVAGIVPVESFNRFFRALQIGKHGLVGLFRSDGTVLAREPAKNFVGESFSALPFFAVHVARAPDGFYRQISQTDGIERLNAYRTVAGYPLVVSVSIAVNDILGTWYRDVAVYGAIWLACVFAFALIAMIKLRQLAREEQAATELRRSRESADNARRQLAAVMDNVVDGLIVVDERGVMTRFSRAAEKIFGYRSDEVVGHEVSMLMADRRTAFHHELLREGPAHMTGGRQVQGRRKDGSIFPLDLAVGEIPNTSGVRQFVGTLRDITGRLMTEEQLRQSQKLEAVGQLTGGIAHDFNNLLAVVIANLSFLAEDGEKGAPADPKLVESAFRAARRGADLTQRLLAFSRQMPSKPEATEIDRRVLHTVELLRRTLGENIAIATDLAAGSACAHVDGVQLENAIVNLALNARDAMPEGGSLTIATRLEAARIRISIADTGHGMAPEILSKVFEPFFTTKPVGKGSGLGMSMVYGFVQQSGGEVTIDSKPGTGTRVVLSLPQIAAAERPRAPRPSPKGQAIGAGKTVLLVEDDPDVRAATEIQLMRLGFEVRSAVCGEDAVALLRSEIALDLLLTDIRLSGGLDGFGVARCARGLRPGLAVLCMSGYAAPTGQHADDSADKVHLPKPFTRDQLIQALTGLPAQ